MLHRPSASPPKATPAEQFLTGPASYATRLETMLVAEPQATRVPILTENEALVVVELLEHLIAQPIQDRMADLARTVIVRILDRVDHSPPMVN
jgi:hypothetical protein